MALRATHPRANDIVHHKQLFPSPLGAVPPPFQNTASATDDNTRSYLSSVPVHECRRYMIHQ